jgi:hypothetical protein
MGEQQTRRRTEPVNQVGPHRFTPLRRFFNKGRCRACFVPERAHPVEGWTRSRSLGDSKIGVTYGD